MTNRKPKSNTDDKRKALLVYLPSDQIKDLKKSAIDIDRTVSSVVEEAVSDWLSNTRQSNNCINAV